MSFTSLPFAVLFAIVLAARHLLFWRGGTGYRALLLVSSLVFYGWQTPEYLGLILLSAAIDYQVGARIAALDLASPKRWGWLQISLVANLGLLGFFKYSTFLLRSFRYALGAAGLSNTHVPLVDVALPVGISFFTFQSMSYTIDIYRGVLAPVRSFRDFLLFVSFFPQLVAGPIVRARDFLPQLYRRRRPAAAPLLAGVSLVVQGFFLKSVLADNLSVYVNKTWGSIALANACGLHATVVVIAFGAQIFADFAGYSKIARGLAYLLGFRLPENFDAPYLACSLREFWRRWHITLSTWLRDYLYFGLGGSHHGTWRTFRNLLLTMGLGGLWHGAAWTFLAWGLLHGLGLVAERMAFGTEAPKGPGRWVRWPIVQGWILITWVFFRSSTLPHAVQICRNLLLAPWTTPATGLLQPELAPVLAVGVLHLLRVLNWRSRLGRAVPYLEAAGTGAMAYAILSLSGGRSAFLYFRF